LPPTATEKEIATEDSCALRDPLLANLGGERRPKPIPPETYGLLADADPALGQEILYIPQRQRVLHVHHLD
jgi:hypothetical protein